MPGTSELATKSERLLAWLARESADGAFLCREENVAWLACGGELQRPDAPAAFLVAADRRVLLVPAEDADRVRQEELRGTGVEILPAAGTSPAALAEQARALVPAGKRLAADVPGLGIAFAPPPAALRSTFLPEEIDRLNKLGRDAARVLEDVASECYRGVLEREVAGRLAAECIRHQIRPRSLLAGADERIETYPRPVPKGAAAERVLALGLVAARGGLHVVVSRMICLVRPTAAQLDRYATLADLAARLQHECRAGETIGAAVQRALARPGASAGRLGGVCGYGFPEEEAHPGSLWKLKRDQALGWTLAAPGVLCHETMLVGSEGAEVVTTSDNWPHRRLTIGGRDYEIPDLMLL
jgi:Xaa-Pro aminopeptidase